MITLTPQEEYRLQQASNYVLEARSMIMKTGAAIEGAIKVLLNNDVLPIINQLADSDYIASTANALRKDELVSLIKGIAAFAYYAGMLDQPTYATLTGDTTIPPIDQVMPLLDAYVGP